jgi:DNA polymerase-3 subunit alpha
MVMPHQFVHLHAHSEFSLLDGMSRVEDLVKRTKELGMKAVALTDHGNMYAAVKFYLNAREHGIKPILGCEVYLAPRSRFDKETREDRSPSHLTLLAKDMDGYRNLI